MTEKSYFLIAGILFTIVALVHLARIFGGWTIVINDWSVPLGASWVGFFVTAILGFYGLKFGQKNP